MCWKEEYDRHNEYEKEDLRDEYALDKLYELVCPNQFGRTKQIFERNSEKQIQAIKNFFRVMQK